MTQPPTRAVFNVVDVNIFFINNPCCCIIIAIAMKQLTDDDIAKMAGTAFVPDDTVTRRRVRSELQLSRRIPAPVGATPAHVTLDLHQHTVDQAWDEIMVVATSGARRATIITGASGVLRKLFPQWVSESILSPYILSATPINNGSFDVKFKRIKNENS